MAQEFRFVCTHCHKTIKAWSDGDPYYLDFAGKKHYAYHPDEEFALCTAHESPYLCLACGRKFKVDSEKPISACPCCKSTEISDCEELDGKGCPFCNGGNFRRDPNYWVIS